MNSSLRHETHSVDFCVIGGGMAGICAAVSAARHGATVALMHDRPVLGGNASSECRVHICGADRHNGRKHMRETGILEELRLANLYRNPNKNFSVWDTVLYEAVRFEPNITLLLNCTCMDAATDGTRIERVTGWQLTTQTHHTIEARIFADCSGDGILAPLTGAEWRKGREARAEFNESIAPEEADDYTMGMTCLFQAREYDTPQPFDPPAWANRYDSCDEIPYGRGGHRYFTMGYWWIELGGEYDSIHDTERLRDELLKITYGVWDHIKNRCEDTRETARNWAIEWIQCLPAKRESRRYVGDHVLNQNDVDAEGSFDDLVAYGGWSMDDHHPAGFRAVQLKEKATIFHHAPIPYGIPYRALYSKNIDNLMFAGRCASCTHAAMSSTRVMGTCSSMGQAVGTAAAMAISQGTDPRAVGEHMHELQQQLLYDDCYLPWVLQEMPALTKDAALAASQGDPEPVRDGVNRQVGDDPHCWTARVGDTLDLTFDAPRRVAQLTLILDSGMDLNIAMSYHQPDDQLTAPPPVTPKRFRVQVREDGEWRDAYTTDCNYQRLVRVPVDVECTGVRFVLDETWGAEESRVYGAYVEGR